MRAITSVGLAFLISVTSVNGLGWLLPQWGIVGYRQRGITFAVSTIMIAISYLVTFHQRG